MTHEYEFQPRSAVDGRATGPTYVGASIVIRKVDKDYDRTIIYEGSIEKLAEMIERLPVTADGVPVVPGDYVWTWVRDELTCVELVYINKEGGKYLRCYSTREAAEAAARGEER